MRVQIFDVKSRERLLWLPLAENVYVLLLVLVGCSPSVETVARTTDQAKLARAHPETLTS